MKIPETMTVEYMGQKFDVPVWVNYIAADTTGGVYGYEFPPRERACGGTTIYINQKGNCISLGYIRSYPILKVGESK